MNGRYETPMGKERPIETPQAPRAPRRLPDRRRKASALRSNQRLYSILSQKKYTV
ncbi:hypothetical protein ACIP97_11225 [Peribacillus frigoritolerans]|uniref:hypothetical protein n=1 Tax=Peribacillus frigoritolerans TaxID=450367 RepID=UPI0037F2BB21